MTGGGGSNTDRVAEGHCEGEGVGGKLKLPPFHKEEVHCNTLKMATGSVLMSFYASIV